MKRAAVTIALCMILSGCSGGVRQEVAPVFEWGPEMSSRISTTRAPDEPTSVAPIASDHRISPPEWEWTKATYYPEPDIGLPIRCWSLPSQHEFIYEYGMHQEASLSEGQEDTDTVSAPEVLEIFTYESGHPLPLEEPDRLEDMVVQETPSFLGRMDGEGAELSPLAELEKEMVHDIPVVMNDYVQKYLEYFQNGARKYFERWLARSHRYLPMMQQLMAENGLPEDLAYMAMIESGFNPRAYSRAHAVGPWQFIESTAKKYGLRVDWWVDERRDPEKSTRAAIAYLKDLYNMFGSWYLAAASYNAGEKRISQLVTRGNTDDFWTLSRLSRGLKRETKAYIPKLISAIIISKNPEKYGFSNIDPKEPLMYDRVVVQGSMDLRVLAKACNTTYEQLKDLNPELKHWITPPRSRGYCLKVPQNTGVRFYQRLAEMKPLDRVTFGGYVVQRGDTLLEIARRFGSSVSAIMEANRIANPRRLRPGQKLFIPGKPIPVQRKGSNVVASLSGRDGNSPSSMKSTTPAQRSEMPVHILRKGETLWDIARQYSVNLGELMRINAIGNPRSLRPGACLKIPHREGMSPVAEKESHPQHSSSRASEKKQTREIIYTVRKGDNLWAISQRFGIEASHIQQWNNLDKRARIYPGDKLRLIVDTEIL